MDTRSAAADSLTAQAAGPSQASPTTSALSHISTGTMRAEYGAVVEVSSSSRLRSIASAILGCPETPSAELPFVYCPATSQTNAKRGMGSRVRTPQVRCATDDDDEGHEDHEDEDDLVLLPMRKISSLAVGPFSTTRFVQRLYVTTIPALS
jgi:hypothetical protein